MYLSKLLNVFGSKINISRKCEVGGFYSDKTMLDKNSVNSNLRNSRNLDFEDEISLFEAWEFIDIG